MNDIRLSCDDIRSIRYANFNQAIKEYNDQGIEAIKETSIQQQKIWAGN